MTWRICILLAFALAATAQRKALVGGVLIDGYGGRPIPNSVILIDGEKIGAVGQLGTLTVPPDAQVISTAGMSVLPGLWDMHVHTMLSGHSDYEHWDKTYPPQMESVIMPASAKQLLMAGVTSARDLGWPLEASIHVRDGIRSSLRSRASSPNSTITIGPANASARRYHWRTGASVLCRWAAPIRYIGILKSTKINPATLVRFHEPEWRT
jgi:hypothetical protein